MILLLTEFFGTHPFIFEFPWKYVNDKEPEGQGAFHVLRPEGLWPAVSVFLAFDLKLIKKDFVDFRVCT